MLHNSTDLEQLATELGIQSDFLEKDCYAMEVLKAISTLKSNGITPIFTGGTSLSKAHKLISRFSEDLDFCVEYTNKDYSKATRTEFRLSLIHI